MKNKLNRIISIIFSVIITVTLFTGCAKMESVAEETTVSETTSSDTTVATTTAVTTIVTEPTTTETTVETTTATTVTTAETTVETTRELTAEEIEIMNEMPEIVFVISHHYSRKNISGFYITKYGEVKMYDFRNREERIDDVLDVLDELENATCSEMTIDEALVREEDLKSVPTYKMVEYYKTLLQIDKNSEIVFCNTFEDVEYGYGDYYGIRKINGNIEKITLTGWGNSYSANKDELSNELNVVEVFPQFFYPY